MSKRKGSKWENKVRKKSFIVNLSYFQRDRYTRPDLIIRLPKYIANLFRWGDRVKVNIKEL